MANLGRSFQFGLGLFVMAAFTGIVGFVIIYHYATFERPVRHFAIVVDAGSTQTRSGLFAIDLNPYELDKWKHHKDIEDSRGQDLELMFKAKQVGSCVNGSPLASLKSEWEARQLIGKCLREFAPKIKQLEFYDVATQDDGDDLRDSNDEKLARLELEGENPSGAEQVDSITHIYLGATAGMRALNELNETRASEKIHWVERAIDESQSGVAGPFINKGFVGILDGSDEAAFGWSSVNFVCDRLFAESEPVEEVATDYTLHEKVESIGTLELGGASAQMAYELADLTSGSDSSLQLQHMELFNQTYRLATRSDLCLGMSQAILRANFILLKDRFDGNKLSFSPQQEALELVNPCFQSQSRLSLSGVQLAQLARGPCLQLNPNVSSSEFAEFVTSENMSKRLIRFLGTGDVDQCALLLNNLVEPGKCRHYFSLCPESKNSRVPPANMNFVTISGYNKALQILELEPQAAAGNQARSISEKLGGRSVSYKQYVDAMRKFCAIDISEFPIKYPKMNPDFYQVNCLQLVYIDKLLTQFYMFDTPETWQQIKFLLFDPEVSASPSDENKHQKSEYRKEDISWTLGLLLNATSEQLTSGQTGDDADRSVFYHHSSSISHVLRATILLMVACVLVAISLLAASLIAAKNPFCKTFTPSERHGSCSHEQV